MGNESSRERTRKSLDQGPNRMGETQQGPGASGEKGGVMRRRTEAPGRGVWETAGPVAGEAVRAAGEAAGRAGRTA